jgi:hypothetical protein
MFGYDYDELIGIFGSDVIEPESKELVRRNMLLGYEETYEAIAQRKDGTTFHAEICGKMTQYKSIKEESNQCGWGTIGRNCRTSPS